MLGFGSSDEVEPIEQFDKLLSIRSVASTLVSKEKIFGHHLAVNCKIQ